MEFTDPHSHRVMHEHAQDAHRQMRDTYLIKLAARAAAEPLEALRRIHSGLCVAGLEDTGAALQLTRFIAELEQWQNR